VVTRAAVTLKRVKSKPAPGTVAVRVTCAAAAKVTLSGSVAMRIAATTHMRARTEMLKLSGLTKQVKAKRATTLTLSLPKAAVAGLRGHRGETLSVKLTSRAASETPTARTASSTATAKKATLRVAR
jgi:hypothetical protein